MLFIIVGLIFAWIMKPTNIPTSSESVSTPFPSAKSNMTSFKSQYMEGCVETDFEGSTDYCECTYNYLDDRLTDKGFVDMAIEYYDTEESPELMYQAVNSCLYLIK